MNTRTSPLPLLLTLLFAVPAAAQAAYHVTPLDLIPGATQSFPFGLGELGGVAGHSVIGSATHAFYRAPGATPIDIGELPGAFHTSASDCNTLGQVVGESGDRAYRYTPGVGMEDLTGGQLSRANAINEHGRVAGTLNPYAFLGFTAFVFDDATGVTPLVPGSLGRAFDINAAGQVAGYASSTAFRYTPGTGVLFLPLAPGFAYSYATAINRHGQVAGTMTSASGNTVHAFLFTDGVGLVDLGSLAAGGGIASLNAAGHGVGSRDAGSGDRAILWTPTGGMQELNDLIPAGSGYLLRSAREINDAGQIVCSAWDSSTFSYRSVRLDPITSMPASIPLGLGCGTPPPRLDGSAPRLGQAASLSVTSALVASPAVLFASVGLPSISDLGAGCTGYLPSAFALLAFSTATTGVTTLPYSVPSSPALVGFGLGLQAAVFGAPGPTGFELTNGLWLVIG